MKSIGEAKPGEFCYYDLHITPEEPLNMKEFESHLQYSKADVLQQNVLIISIEPINSYEYGPVPLLTIRYNCIKLAEPDMSKMKEKFIQDLKA